MNTSPDFAVLLELNLRILPGATITPSVLATFREEFEKFMEAAQKLETRLPPKP